MSLKLPSKPAPLDRRRRDGSLTYSLLHDKVEALDRQFFSAVLEAAGEPGPNLPRASFLRMLRSQGLYEDDERLQDVIDYVYGSDEHLTQEEARFLRTKCSLIWRTVNDRLIIPDFPSFSSVIRDLYEETLPVTSGKNASYIPQLARVDPDQFGVAVCTVDGQRYAVGDVTVPFCVQSCSKVVTYAIAQKLHGADLVHRHVGVEPSGRAFNQMCLDERAKFADLRAKRDLLRRGEVEKADSIRVRPAVPHNPCINAGAIMCASLVLPEASADERFDYVMGIWRQLCGYNPRSSTLCSPTFAASTYLSERASADRNFCLAYMMKEEGAFLPGTDILATLDSYFMYCSIECTVHTLSVVAATFANEGTCPVTGVRVFDHLVVRNCLSVMQTCGMYDYSGTFAYRMGFPAKSGVGGALMIVVPGVCGFCTWSPRLDEIGNSSRGVHFCKLLANRFAFNKLASNPTWKDQTIVSPNNIESLRSSYFSKCTPEARKRLQRAKALEKLDPLRPVTAKEAMTDDDNGLQLLWAAYDNNIDVAMQLLARGLDVNWYDYDLRTALHIASSEGHIDLVRYLLQAGADPLSIDKFGGTPISEAKHLGLNEVVELLEEALAAEKKRNSQQTVQSSSSGNEAASEAAKNIHRALSAMPAVSSDGFTLELLYDVLERSGIRRDDKRLKPAMEALPPPPSCLLPHHIEMVVSDSFILRALQGHLIIPDWVSFSKASSECFVRASAVTDGHVADYIPILAKADPDKFGVSVCSVDGQRWSKGDVTDDFGIQSSMKPLNYAIALETTSFRNVYQHIGVEPSGRPFNEMVLDQRRVDVDGGGHDLPQRNESGHVIAGDEDNTDDFNPKYDDRGKAIKPTAIPHNPMINAGAIMCCALIEEGKDVATKIETFRRYWEHLTGGEKTCDINEEMYRSESETASRNRCLAYMMQEAGTFPEAANLEVELEFYFRCCSMMQNAESCSIVAGTLANGGVCPVTDERIFSPLTVQCVLSVMFTCGMYDFSGQFSFSMGFPSKSGVGGSCLIVIPNIMGICTWSPRLDGNGNSCRGIAFAEELAGVYQIHVFDKATETIGDVDQTTKQDLRFRPDEENRDLVAQAINAAATDDIATIESMMVRYGVALFNMADYDRRTPLHLACTEGQIRTVKLLAKQPGLNLEPRDHWGVTPLDIAKKLGFTVGAEVLEEALSLDDFEKQAKTCT